MSKQDSKQDVRGVADLMASNLVASSHRHELMTALEDGSSAYDGARRDSRRTRGVQTSTM